MTVAHTERAHARLSPSGASRWVACPGSIRLSDGIADTSSVFADEGTAAHTLGEQCLNTGFDAAHYIGRWVDIDGDSPLTRFLHGKGSGRCFEVTEEMAEAVQVYIDVVREYVTDPAFEVEIEQRVDLSHIEGMDKGTADMIAFRPDDGYLVVCDLKYGKGVAVEVDDNPQLKTYGLGAAWRYHNRGLTKVELIIVQPRSPHPKGPVRRWVVDALDMLEFQADLRVAAARTEEATANASIQNGELILDEDWNALYLKAGSHCKFCKAAPFCPAKRAKAYEIAGAEFGALGEIELPVVTSMTGDQLAKVLAEIDQLDDWSRRVKEFAHHEATHGRTPPGFKLVAKRATRKWKEPDAVVSLLEDVYGLDKEQVFKEPEMKSPAQLEPLMPGKNKKERAEALKPLVSAESSGSALAPIADPRPAVRADTSEFAEG